jgi:hypothetical protein
VRICCKVKGFGERRSENTSAPKTRRVCRNFIQLFGWRTLIFLGGIARSHDIRLATFRAARLAIPENRIDSIRAAVALVWQTRIFGKVCDNAAQG